MNGLRSCATALVLMSLCTLPVPMAHATSGHESGCTVINSAASAGEIHFVCSSGTVYYANLTGSAAATAWSGCQTTDMDTMKMWFTLATAARLSDKTMQIWYEVGCQGTIRMIDGIEMEGN